MEIPAHDHLPGFCQLKLTLMPTWTAMSSSAETWHFIIGSMFN